MLQPRYIFVTPLVALFSSGCQSLGTPLIQPDSMALPRGSRVLIAEAIERGRGYEIIPPRQALSLSGLTVVAPPEAKADADSISGLLQALLSEQPADMAFVLAPQTVVERGYAPYPALKGWYKNTIREGSVYRTKEEPVYETRYRYSCVRTTYRIFQYDARARLKGISPIKPEAPRPCPETAAADIHFDEYRSAVRWLTTHVRANE